MIPLTNAKKIRIAVAAACIAALLFSCHKTYIVQSDYRTAVPLQIQYDTTGGQNSVTPHVVININGQAIDVIFDTGSNGLRILNGALHGAPVDSDTEWVSIGYGFSPPYFYIRGNVAGGDFSINGLSNNNSLRFMVIRSTSADSTGPWNSTLDSTAISSGHFHNFEGIMGVGFRLTSGNNGIANPLAQLPGNGSYIVEFPPYTGATGSVIINPNSSDAAGFVMFPLTADFTLLPNGMNSWQDNMLNGTLTVNGTPISGTTLIDSGDPTTDATAVTLPFTGLVPPGESVSMQLTEPDKTVPSVSSTFKVSTQTSGKDLAALVSEKTGPTRVVFGVNIFFQYDIFYDQANGRIGLRKKQFVP